MSSSVLCVSELDGPLCAFRNQVRNVVQVLARKPPDLTELGTSACRARQTALAGLCNPHCCERVECA